MIILYPQQDGDKWWWNSEQFDTLKDAEAARINYLLSLNRNEGLNPPNIGKCL